MSKSDDTWEMLTWAELRRKVPYEIEALKSTTQANEESIKLAKKTKGHFSKIERSNSTAIKVSIGVAILTLIALLVQLYLPQKVEVKSLNKIIFQQEKGMQMQLEERHLLLQRVDSLTTELQRLSKSVNSRYIDSVEGNKE